MAKSDTTRVVSKGVCNFCKGEFEKGKMTQHLKGCKERKSVLVAEETGKSRQPKKSKLFHIIVEGQYLPMYWMHLEMPSSITLEDLDGFLRDIWLECCGHLSEFRIGDISYSAMEEEEMFWPNAASVVDAEAEEDSALCKQCAKKDDEWGYEEMLPIMNSPRTGVCGYTGD